MTQPTARISATASKAELFAALVALVDSPQFDHRQWSLYEADELVRVGGKIRERCMEDLRAGRQGGNRDGR